MITEVQNFSDFSYSLNEGNSYKKQYGIIGPFSNWGYKLKTSCPENGGEVSDSQIIISGLNSDDDVFKFKYLYGEGKESDELVIPKGSFTVEGSQKNPILQTKKNIKWFDDEENQSQMDDFINSFIESKHFKLDLDEDIEGDLYSIMEILDIEDKIEKIENKKDLYWIAGLEGGSEIEIKKRDKDNLFKMLKFFFTKDSYSPDIEISHEKPGYEVKYTTPKGSFIRQCQKIGDLVSDPVHKYLFSTALKRDLSPYNEPLLNYYNSILRGHDWTPKSKEKTEEFISSEREINNIKKILSNSISESDLDEIYTQAREKYSPSKPNK